MDTGRRRRWLAGLLAFVLLLAQTAVLTVRAEETASTQSQIVLTLGADLSAEQKAYILQYFGISEGQVTTITITNADEQSQLGNLISAEQIGTHTLSCALIRLTSSGGIQVKTANMNYVTSNMIASQLCTSGVYNCEVLTAAPFEVSGTGALTGVMMAYETASGEALDTEKKELANEELVLTGEISETVGQDQATLVVNDIKIHIVRDQLTEQEDVNAAVDEVIATTEQAAAEAAASQGMEAPATLGEVEHEQLYNFGYKYSQMGYNYSDVQETLERVTRNVTKSSGIDDPITDTFTTSEEDSTLSIESILLNTDDSVLGEDAIINATNSVAIGEHEAEPIDVFTGAVTLTEAGGIKADSFISDTSLLAYQDVNGSYALLDLNGNLLTESIYTSDFSGECGYVTAVLNDGSGICGLLDTNGDIVVPFQYADIEVPGEQWAIGITLGEGTDEDYDYYDYDGGKYVVASADVYYLGGESPALVATLAREQLLDGEAFGSYLNIQDRSGIITTYDSSFNALQNVDYLSDFGDYDEDSSLRSVLENNTGYYVGSFYGSYAKITDNNTWQYGVMDRYGNVIIPAQFDYIYNSYENYDYSYETGGYFAAKTGENFVFVTAGGTITGSFAYSTDNITSYGMAALYKGDDGSYIILSGDGQEANLGTTYSYVRVLRGSGGMFWVGEGSSGYDLLDWHGNVLVSGSDGFSISSNGNYIIAETGYTSSTLYLVNDASPVSIADSVGGAAELETATEEGASLEAYAGEPEVTLVGDVYGTSFVDGTHLIPVSVDGTNYALFDTAGNQLTSAEYTKYFEYSDGWLIAELSEDYGSLQGLLSMEGAEIIPCEYGVIDVLNENWVIGYKLNTNGTEDDYDYYDWEGNYFQIEQAVVYHISEEELTYVTLTRDQIADAGAEEDYINIQDRTTGAVTTYDSTFTAVASASYTSDFSGFSSMEVLAEKLKDSTGLYADTNSLADGYMEAHDYSQENTLAGIIDMEGNIIIPIEYDDVLAYYSPNAHRWARGYFAVEKDGLVGYVTKDGAVTCELKYPEDSFYNEGVAGYYRNEDDTYTLVAADGTENTGYESLYGYGGGLFWRT
ncbi:MAG: DUF1002 domain-containing protein, partial [Lachnospiraceae bacterium]|nr:DUF1002 domain-containing protein [Lachnospiraceae bacterium]